MIQHSFNSVATPEKRFPATRASPLPPPRTPGRAPRYAALQLLSAASRGDEARLSVTQRTYVQRTRDLILSAWLAFTYPSSRAHRCTMPLPRMRRPLPRRCALAACRRRRRITRRLSRAAPHAARDRGNDSDRALGSAKNSHVPQRERWRFKAQPPRVNRHRASRNLNLLYL